MWNGKTKAVTFSYDDGVTQDIRLTELFNEYGLKCTFNLNSGIMNETGSFQMPNLSVHRLAADKISDIYKGHEIAVHTLTHPNLLELDDNAVRDEILKDKSNLEHILNTKINGMAYPYGTFDERIIRIAEECEIKFARTVNDTHDFTIPKDLLTFGASCHHSYENLEELTDSFLEHSGSDSVILCIWGHSYEFDRDNNWNVIEDFCKKISGRDDIFYGTNSEVYLK